MHAGLLTLLLLTGAPEPPMDGSAHVITTVDDCSETAADVCCGQPYPGRCPEDGRRGCFSAWLGPMPQTCYSPRFGCYPGNNRHMHRYPAFHGNYYRQPYNYRRLFDFPWHVTPQEPVGFFTYQGGQPTEEDPMSALPEGRVLSEPLRPVPDVR